MYLYNAINKQQNLHPIFEKEPIMSRLSHSFNDAHWSYPYHVHKEDTELIYFSNGKADYQINNEVFKVKKGDLLIVNKGSIHSIASDSKDPISCWTCGIMNFKLSNSLSPEVFLPMNKKPHMKAGNQENLIYDIFNALEYFSKQDTTYSLSICNSLANALANIYFNIFENAVVETFNQKNTFVQDILFYINENYSQPISLKKLSEKFHMSSDHISHKFQEIYGISPINYTIDRRISEAKWKLINTKDSLVSISLQVGYENTSHFSNLFLKRVGYPPLVYREKFGMNPSSIYHNIHQ